MRCAHSRGGAAQGEAYDGKAVKKAIKRAITAAMEEVDKAEERLAQASLSPLPNTDTKAAAGPFALQKAL